MNFCSRLFSLNYRLGLSYLALLVLVVLAMPSYSHAANNRIVSLVGDPWPPYVNGKMGEYSTSGIAVEIAMEIFSQIENVDVKFPLIPWNRALREVEEGESEGIAMLLKTAEREKYIHYSEPLLMGTSLIWSARTEQAKSFEWQTVEDLHGYKIGIIKGYSYGESLDSMFESGKLASVSVPTVKQLFAMLANERIDIAIATDAVGYSLAREYPEIAIEPAEKPVLSETFYMGFSKKSWITTLIPEINSAIRSLQANGTINRIIKGAQ